VTTVWHTRINAEPRQWLLENGEILTEPTMEQSGSGVKVRIAAMPSLSAYAKDADALITRAVRTIADRKQTAVWMGLHGSDGARNAALGFNPDETRADLFLHNPAKRATIAWWRFRHPTLPIEAVVALKAYHVNHNQPAQGQLITGTLSMPVTNDYQLASSWRTTKTAMLNPIVPSEAGAEREFVRDNQPEWLSEGILGDHRCASETEMVRQLLDLVRRGEGLETIEVPDQRQTTDLGWLELELYETNVNSEFIADLVDYLDGSASVAEALRIYEDLRRCMRGLGIYLAESNESDFNRGLIGGEDRFVTVGVGMAHEDLSVNEKGLDHNHRLKMHLPSGTFIVDCDVKDTDKGEAVTRWEEAMTIASITGEEDVLVEFARAVAADKRKNRAKTILNQRTTPQHTE
jgi:hypothetical protein